MNGLADSDNDGIRHLRTVRHRAGGAVRYVSPDGGRRGVSKGMPRRFHLGAGETVHASIVALRRCRHAFHIK